MKTSVKVLVTTRRPNGKIEEVLMPSLAGMTTILFNKIKDNTRKAGRGEVLSYRVEYPKIETAEDKIEGVKEIREALRIEVDYRLSCQRAIESGSGTYPAPIKTNLENLKMQYPIAVAYLRAEEYSQASNFEKATAGVKAMRRLLAGEDYKFVNDEMETEWSTAAASHMWD